MHHIKDKITHRHTEKVTPVTHHNQAGVAPGQTAAGAAGVPATAATAAGGVAPIPVVMPGTASGLTQPVYVPLDSLPPGTVIPTNKNAAGPGIGQTGTPAGVNGIAPAHTVASAQQATAAAVAGAPAASGVGGPNSRAPVAGTHGAHDSKHGHHGHGTTAAVTQSGVVGVTDAANPVLIPGIAAAPAMAAPVAVPEPVPAPVVVPEPVPAPVVVEEPVVREAPMVAPVVTPAPVDVVDVTHPDPRDLGPRTVVKEPLVNSVHTDGAAPTAVLPPTHADVAREVPMSTPATVNPTAQSAVPVSTGVSAQHATTTREVAVPVDTNSGAIHTGDHPANSQAPVPVEMADKVARTAQATDTAKVASPFHHASRENPEGYVAPTPTSSGMKPASHIQPSELVHDVKTGDTTVPRTDNDHAIPVGNNPV